MNKIEKFEKLQLYLSQLSYKIDIIVLGETKIMKRFPINLYNLNGYEQIVCFREADQAGGGLLLFINKTLISSNIECTSSSFEKISLNLHVNNFNFKLIAYYRPPVRSNTNDFMNDLESELQKTANEKVVIVGDININSTNNNSESSDYLNLLNAYDMKIINTFVTRLQSKKIIDHVVVNFCHERTLSSHTIQMKDNFTDHNMIVTFIGINTERKSVLRNYTYIDYNKLKSKFNELNKTVKFNDYNDCDLIAEKLTEITQTAISFSTNKIVINWKANDNICPWYNWKIIKSIKIKVNLAARVRKNRSNMHLKKRLDMESSKLKKLIENERRKFYDNRLSESNPKKLWKNLNNILGREKTHDIKAIYSADNELITDNINIAQRFNEHFIDSVAGLVNTNSVHYPTFEKFPAVTQSIYLHKPDVTEINQIINSLKSASCGLDGIKPAELKVLNNQISPIICQLIETIFETGKYPASLRTALVIPINKSGKHTDVSDYRPISILNVFNKIIEKVLYKRLMKFIDNKINILYKFQYGFRPKSNTETAATELVDHIRECIDNKKKVSAVFMDYKKAFDLVDHKILLTVLNKYGIRGKANDIIKNYLSSRQQIVKIGNERSNPIAYSTGVVQGGVLSSLLFVLYINAISYLDLNGKIFLYADDAVLVNSHAVNESIDSKIQTDMSRIIEFTSQYRIVINWSKTNYMIFKSPFSSAQDSDSIYIGPNQHIHKVEEMRYLGLWLDPSLKFDLHGKKVEAKTASASGILWKLKNRLNTKRKKLIYHTLFESHINYMLTIWGSANDTVIAPLQVNQNRALRNVFNLDRFDNRIEMYLHNVENCLPIRAMHYVNTAVFIFNIVNEKVLSNIRLHTAHTTRTTRNSNQYKPCKFKSNFGKRMIQTLGIKIYNNVPQTIKELTSHRAFKWALKCTIRRQDFISNCFSNMYLKLFSSQ